MKVMRVKKSKMPWSGYWALDYIVSSELGEVTAYRLHVGIW